MLFVRKPRSEANELKLLLQGLFGLDPAAEPRISASLEVVGDDAFRSLASRHLRQAEVLVQELQDLPLVTDEPTGEGSSTWFHHVKITDFLANRLFDLFVPFVEVIENSLKGMIASGRATLELEYAAIALREEIVDALRKAVFTVLSAERKNLFPDRVIFPYAGVAAVMRCSKQIQEFLTDFAKSMRAFADQAPGQLVKAAAFRSQASQIQRDAEVWECWRCSHGQIYWRLPDDKVVMRTIQHLTTYLLSVRKELTKLPADPAQAEHPESAYALQSVRQVIEELLAVLPKIEQSTAS